MTEENMRVALAEFEGWKIGKQQFDNTTGKVWGYRWEHPDYHVGNSMSLHGWGYNDEAYTIALPALTLDHIHKLEQRLTDEQLRSYTEHLAGATEAPYHGMSPIWFGAALIRATAPQKAEAMLRALGKWEEGA